MRNPVENKGENDRLGNRTGEPYPDRISLPERTTKLVAIHPQQFTTSSLLGRASLDKTNHPTLKSTRQAESEEDKAEITDELHRILASKTFEKAFRLRELLNWIVLHWLEDHDKQLDCYAIAIAVFSRDESFDASIDPIVRVEASRLRRRLQKYYSGEGISDAVRIDLPSGTYTPQVFHPQFQNLASTADPSGLELGTVTILPFDGEKGDNQTAPISRKIHNQLIRLLTQERSVHVLSRITATQMGFPLDVLRLRKEFGIRFVVEGAIVEEEAISHLIIYLTDTSNGYNIWSGYYCLKDVATANISRQIVADIVNNIRETKVTV